MVAFCLCEQKMGVIGAEEKDKNGATEGKSGTL